MEPVNDWRPEHSAVEVLPQAPPGHHHLQSQETSVVLAVQTDPVPVHRIDGCHRPEGLLLSADLHLDILLYLMASN